LFIRRVASLARFARFACPSAQLAGALGWLEGEKDEAADLLMSSHGGGPTVALHIKAGRAASKWIEKRYVRRVQMQQRTVSLLSAKWYFRRLE
jgi:hypothetical protein